MPKQNPDASPNVVFVFPDQLSAAWLSTYGCKDVNTPNIDRFAQEGLLFKKAYTASPLCTPYRGSLFTGRYPCQTGINDNNLRVPSSEVMLGRLFKDHGYHTAYIGKWHLSGPPHCNRWVPPEERGGFETFIGWESSHVDHWQGIAFEGIDQPIQLKGHETDGLTEVVCSQLDRLASRDEPFCMFVSYQAPHAPCSPPEEYMKRDRPFRFRPNTDRTAVWTNHYRDRQDWPVEKVAQHYWGEVEQLDAAFGRMMAHLDQLGLRDNTIVVFTSDHGEMLGCHGYFEKGCMYEESVHVPLMVRYPGADPGRVTHELFSSVDFFPTLLDLCNLPAAPTAEGINYAPLIKGDDHWQEDDGRDYVYVQNKHLCIIGPDSKLVTDLTGVHPIAFFDLKQDPYELKNLMLSHKFNLDMIQHMHNRLKHWHKDALTRIGRPEETMMKAPAIAALGL